MSVDLTATAGSDTVPVEGGTVTGRVTITTDFERDAKTRPKHLALCIDASPSMDGTKINNAKEGAKEAVDILDDRDYISVVKFSKSATRVLDPTQLSSNRRRIKKQIGKISTTGGTNIIAGIKGAKAALDETSGSGLLGSLFGSDDGEFLRWIVLVSDGKPTTISDMMASLMPHKSSVERHVAVAEELADDGVTIQAVGVGPAYNEDIIRGVAEATRGKPEHLSDSAEFADYFRSLVEGASDVVELSPSLSLTPRGDVTVGEVYQHEPRLNEFDPDGSRGTLTLDLPDLEAKVTQEILVELEVPAGDAGAERLLLDVELSVDDETASDTVVIEYAAADATLTLDDRKRINTKARRLAVDDSAEAAAAYLKKQDDDAVFDDTRDYVQRLRRAAKSGNVDEEKTIKNELTKPGLTSSSTETRSTSTDDNGPETEDDPKDEATSEPEEETDESNEDDGPAVVREDSKEEAHESDSSDDAGGQDESLNVVREEDAETDITGILSDKSVSVGQSITVEVRDETGARVEGATIQHGAGQATTDDRGRSELSFDESGKYDLTVRKEGPFGSDTVTVSVTAPDASDEESKGTDDTSDTAVVAIPDAESVAVGAPLVVTVRDEMGTRLSGIRVTAGGVSTITDDRGRCRLTFDSPGEYDIVPDVTDREGYHGTPTQVTVEAA